ncbi:hypothetical protein [Edwardsiella tarda]|uniref:hypothetical protein n=1 Tax=Edwardsiella tarda TaxID=636 RepID=UPI001267777B|nr:hypothetical protein [Edwardsiella tarda]
MKNSDTYSEYSSEMTPGEIHKNDAIRIEVDMDTMDMKESLYRYSVIRSIIFCLSLVISVIIISLSYIYTPIIRADAYSDRCRYLVDGNRVNAGSCQYLHLTLKNAASGK